VRRLLQVPEFRVSYSIETDKLDELYKKLKPKGVTMTALLAKACGVALVNHPLLHAGEGWRPLHSTGRRMRSSAGVELAEAGGWRLEAGGWRWLRKPSAPAKRPDWPTPAPPAWAVGLHHATEISWVEQEPGLCAYPLLTTTLPAPLAACTPDGSGITYNEHINVALAVAMPDGGLITPVLKDADRTDLYQVGGRGASAALADNVGPARRVRQAHASARAPRVGRTCRGPTPTAPGHPHSRADEPQLG
jgi:hypothetical protein